MSSPGSHCQTPKQISLCPHIFTTSERFFPGACHDFPVKLLSFISFVPHWEQRVGLMHLVCRLSSPWFFTLLNFWVWMRQNFSWQTSPELSREHSSCCPIQDGLNPKKVGMWAHVGSPQLLGRDLQLICVSAQSSPDLCASWARWHELQHQEMPRADFSKENLAHSSTALLRWQAQPPPQPRALNPSSEWGLMTTLEGGFKISS